MKKKLGPYLTGFIIMIILAGCGKKVSDTDITKDYLINDERRESYVLGHDLAGIMMSSEDYMNEFSDSFFFKGFNDRYYNITGKGIVEKIRYAFEEPDSAAFKIWEIDIKGISNRKEKQSYILGVFHADRIMNNPETFNYICFEKGFSDRFRVLPPILNENEMDLVRNTAKKKIEELGRNADISVSSEEKAELNRKFLIDNSKREAVRKLPDGLQYVVINEGKGEKVKGTDKIKVGFRGAFIDGREFDSSYKKGKPAVITLEDDIIEGWKKGISLMRIGARYKFFIPSELAYGEKGMMDVPPNATLIYDIEVLGIIDDKIK